MQHKKNLLAIVFAATLFSCGSTTPTSLNYSLGKMNSETLFSTHRQFLDNFQSSEVSLNEQELIASWPSDIEFDVYFGTWCHDSEREVPKLLKILSYNSALKLNLVGLDYRKTEPNGTAKANGVQFTPTIIVTRGGKELGRIVERPTMTLVQDITQFIKKHSV